MSKINKGKTLLAETKALISKAVLDENHPNFGQTRSTGIKTNISAILGSAIFVYDLEGLLVNSFSSTRKAAEYFNSNHPIIIRYLRNNLLF